MREVLQKLALAGAGLALAGGAAVAVSAPAAAAPAAVPSCVQGLIADGAAEITVLVRNNCDFPVRVRVRYLPGPDGPCTTVPARFAHRESRAKPVSYAGLTTC